MHNRVDIAHHTGVVPVDQVYAIIEVKAGENAEFSNSVFSTHGTGEEIRHKPAEPATYSRDILPYQLLAKTTGAELPECSQWLMFLGMNITSYRSTTNAHVITNVAEPIRTKHPERVLSHIPLPQKTRAIAEQAMRLRELSGLEIELLADLFGVTRTTYHNWINGSSIRRKYRNHLLEVLPLVEEAAQRLGGGNALKAWLLTPVSPGGTKPIEYLAKRRYDIFRGFLLRQRTGKEHFQPLTPSNRTFQKRSREEVEGVREQLRPRTWLYEDDDPTGMDG